MTDSTQRPDPRSEQRTDARDPVDRARKTRRGQDYDRFAVDPDKIPDGMSYEFKRFEIGGKPDAEHQIMLRQDGWEPVDGKRHPELMPDSKGGKIIRGDMILMERPQYLTDEARADGRRAARMQVLENEAAMKATPAETLERTVARVARTREAVREIPE